MCLPFLPPILPIAALAILLAAGPAAAADAPPAAGVDRPPSSMDRRATTRAPLVERIEGGLRLLALAPDAGDRFDVAVLPPAEALGRIADAVRLIRRKSPASAAAIDRLTSSGPVTLVYFPNNFRDRTRLNSQTVALFLPDFLKDRGLGSESREFTVVVNQFGVKWPAGELAAVIVHELAGHGTQHLEGRIAGGRALDLECEASLYQERAYQDFGVPKRSRTVVLFRRQMEYRFCADFRAFMRKRAPGGLALWDSIDPDVPTLLDLFAGYRGIQAALRPGGPRPRPVLTLDPPPLSARSR